MLYGGLMVLIGFICIAMMWPEGMWGNVITFVNVVLAVIVAMNFFEPLAAFLDPKVPSFTYYWDFLSQWLIFVVALAIFSISTDAISKHQVRFKMPVEQAGRAVFAMATAWVFICFTTATIHTAPLARTSFRGSFQANGPLSENLALFPLGKAPDRLLLGFMHSSTKGALANPTPKPFDKDGEYILKYGARREALRKHNVKEGATRVKK